MTCYIQIAVLIEDTEFVGSSMNEKPWKAGKFSLSLRLSLWGEHLGLNTEEVSTVTKWLNVCYSLPLNFTPSSPA